MANEILNHAQEMMGKAISAMTHEFAKVRTGRASVSLLDDVRVDYYGTQNPLNQVATISVPEPRLITITPWDASVISAIEKAVASSDLGLTPSNDGKMIRVPIPALTEERRKEMVKLTRKHGEECRVSIRHARREALDSFKSLEKSKEITEDDLKRFSEEVQKLTDQFIKKTDENIEHKEKELMEV